LKNKILKNKILKSKKYFLEKMKKILKKFCKESFICPKSNQVPPGASFSRVLIFRDLYQ
jgi:hypothetical protein